MRALRREDGICSCCDLVTRCVRPIKAAHGVKLLDVDDGALGPRGFPGDSNPHLNAGQTCRPASLPGLHQLILSLGLSGLTLRRAYLELSAERQGPLA